jgi:murein tripeptide amidase MpaA
MPYMSVSAISDAIDHIATTYPAITQVFALPEASVEGRSIRAFKIANGTGSNRAGVLFLGGTHARELINPETVMSFALRLCDAYTNDTGLTFGAKSYTAQSVQTVVNALDIFMLPLVNPDGRAFCMTPGNEMWRKNRAPNPGLPCRGVDINRNYDFLWSSGIGTSTNSCTDVYKGPGAFSEPETRNVRFMLDNFLNIACMVDVHSYSELVLYPWGDDQNQTTDPNQNFQNPAFDGQRGIVGSGYKEYIPPEDLEAFVALAERIRDGIAAVRGRVYVAQESTSLYPTSGTAHDYAYARHFVDTGKRRVLGLTLETAREFQPADAEKNNVITEVSAGLMECLQETLCPADVVQDLVDAIFPLRAMRAFRDRELRRTAAGARYERLLRANSLELVTLAMGDRQMRETGAMLMRVAASFFTDQGELAAREINEQDIAQVTRALTLVRRQASRRLQTAIDSALRDIRRVRGQSLTGAFRVLSRPPPRPTRAASRKKPAAGTRAKRTTRRKTARNTRRSK